jgi:hypothetical protein
MNIVETENDTVEEPECKKLKTSNHREHRAHGEKNKRIKSMEVFRMPLFLYFNTLMLIFLKLIASVLSVFSVVNIF